MFRSGATVQRFTPPPESPRRPIVNARASSATGAADAVVAAALSLLGGDTQQTPGPLVELLLQHGIIRAWQLKRLTDGELSALAVDAAGWSMGELLALREAIARLPSCTTTTGNGTAVGRSEATETTEPDLAPLPPFLQSALRLPSTLCKADLREFRRHKIGMSAWLGCVQAMPAPEAKATLQASTEFMANICAIMLFAVWQMRSSTAAAVADASGYGDIAQIQNFCVSLSSVMLFLGLGGHMTISALTSLQPAARIRADDDFLRRYGKHWAWCMSLYIVGSSLVVACIVMDAWISLKFGYSVALSVVFGAMFVYQSTLDSPLFAAAVPVGLFHAPTLSTVFGVSLDEKLLQAAKQQRTTALELHARRE